MKLQINTHSLRKNKNVICTDVTNVDTLENQRLQAEDTVYRVQHLPIRKEHKCAQNASQLPISKKPLIHQMFIPMSAYIFCNGIKENIL